MDQDLLRAAVTRSRLAATAALRAEAVATDNFNLTATKETALFSLQYLAHLGVIDELCSEFLEGDELELCQAACECVLQEEEVSEERADAFQEAIYSLVNQAFEEFHSHGGDLVLTAHYLGLQSAAMVLNSAGWQGLYPYLEPERGIWGFDACEATAAISLLRGPAEADEFIRDLGTYVSALKPGLIEDVRHQMALPRSLPRVFEFLDVVTCKLSVAEEMRELAVSAWRGVPGCLIFSPFQQDAFALAARAAEGEVDETKLDEYCLHLEEQLVEAGAPPKEGLVGLMRGSIDERLSRNLIFLLKTLKNPKVKREDWTCVLLGAQNLLASGYDQVRYATCLRETLNVATRLGSEDLRPALADLESLFAAEPDYLASGPTLTD